MAKWKPMPDYLTPEIIARFWQRVNVKNDITLCWEWTGPTRTVEGYGHFQPKSADNYGSHRMSYFLHYNVDPKELVVRHTCHNGNCCNPHHLTLGTQKDNVKDQFVRGKRNEKKIQEKIDRTRQSKPMPTDMTQEDADRFWERVVKNDKSECWEQKISSRYGKFKHEKETYSAHRMSFFLFYKKDPKELVVRHKCDNNKCINPHHLELGTYSDNSQDRQKRGRARNQNGGKNSMAKFKDEDIVAIRNFAKSGLNYREISEKFNSTKEYIGQIVRRQSWKHII